MSYKSFIFFIPFLFFFFFFFFQAEDGIRDHCVTGVQTCALPISRATCDRRARTPRGTPPRRAPPTTPSRCAPGLPRHRDRKSTLLNSSHTVISYAVFCLKKKKKQKKEIQHNNNKSESKRKNNNA